MTGPTNNQGPMLLRVEEAAHLLGVSRAKLYAVIKRGDLPVVHIDTSTRISRRALDEYVRSLEQTAVTV